MKIAIDSRFWGLENTGLGRYTMNLIEELAKIDRKNEYYLLLRQPVFDQLPLSPSLPKRGNHSLLTKKGMPGGVLPKNFHPVLAEARHYTVKEQLVLPKVLNSIEPDLVHVPHFNIPVFWRGKLVVTIHDLIKHQSVGPETSTLPAPVYWFKHQIYRQVFKTALERAAAILVPSEFVKEQLVDIFGFEEDKVKVTYEAPEPIYYQKAKKQRSQKAEKQLLEKYHLRRPYLIYVGNAYPHKNLGGLIRALSIANSKPETRNSKFVLVIVSARNVFLDRIKQQVAQLGLQNQVKFLGFVADEELRELYRNSLAFITPSLYEGFGLPGLEAMAAGTLVLAAKASSLPEIYQDQAGFFDPYNPPEMAEKIIGVLKLSKEERRGRIEKAREYSRRFSWKKMAEETLEVYKFIGK